jgi:hypothetical protein
MFKRRVRELNHKKGVSGMRLRFAVIMVLIVFVSFSGCKLADEEEKGSCKFVVYSYGAGFEGVYTIDGDKMVAFKQDESSGGTSYYIYEVTFELPISISITANAVSTSTSSIVIQIFQDSDQVKTNTVSRDDPDDKIVNTVDYKFESTEKEE